MLEYRITFINNVQLEHHNIEELMGAAGAEYCSGVNYVTCVEVQDTRDSYPCWYRLNIYDKHLYPEQCFDRLFEQILDRLDVEEAFITEIERSQTRLREVC